MGGLLLPRNADFAANWHKWGKEMKVNFWCQEVEVQGHITPKLDLETWQRNRR